MSSHSHESPYSDTASAPRPASPPASGSRQPHQSARNRPPAVKSASSSRSATAPRAPQASGRGKAAPTKHVAAAHAAKHTPKPATKIAPKPIAKHAPAKHAPTKHAPAKASHVRSAPAKAAAHDAAPARKSSRRRRSRSGSPYASSTQLTSQPTHRAAYSETRAWLIQQHGAICAYCGRTFAPGVMTLDHVAPRRGQTAYDRRDNLVLACTECNAAKRDLSPIAFLLARRSRASHLLRYGSHLSPMLIDLARSLVPAEELERIAQGREEMDSLDDYDGGSPYSD